MSTSVFHRSLFWRLLHWPCLRRALAANTPFQLLLATAATKHLSRCLPGRCRPTGSFTLFVAGCPSHATLLLKSKT